MTVYKCRLVINIAYYICFLNKCSMSLWVSINKNQYQKLSKAQTIFTTIHMETKVYDNYEVY